MDANKEIRRAVDTGAVAFGYKTCHKNLLQGKGEIVIVSVNLPANAKERLAHLAKIEGKKYFEYPENGLVLGSVCGKPFVISAMIVLEVGKSNVSELIQ